MAPPTVHPLPRPSVTPVPHTDVTLLYAQGQKIGALPLNGTRLDPSRSKTLLTLHVRDNTGTLIIDQRSAVILNFYTSTTRPHVNISCTEQFKDKQEVQRGKTLKSHKVTSAAIHVIMCVFTLVCVCRVP